MKSFLQMDKKTEKQLKKYIYINTYIYIYMLKKLNKQTMKEEKIVGQWTYEDIQAY